MHSTPLTTALTLCLTFLISSVFAAPLQDRGTFSSFLFCEGPSRLKRGQTTRNPTSHQLYGECAWEAKMPLSSTPRLRWRGLLGWSSPLDHVSRTARPVRWHDLR